ncbi:DUF4150 domain-containing protein [Hahella sp. KA22]|uniref:Uncharacterized protein n=1 Tax=Hahella chejuensis (strain KCTC 2396) TaxID=349521 RepID=Q2S6Q3_HAHCH|nr:MULTISPECIES: DUF4150 domain-containing protein [Hahella]ABC33671.1 conserved hypothetical protein [Hahella chejuensis KCTC 2396]AZZ95330.1 DUF4150 domain-containing protein [Hahella sp. KA22]MDG9669609.1 DUF4150 domain-containing protein [Hahella sp. CR1]QAY52975.1 DUF4150 domain-containing protein [Hahella sp. KA22]
MGVTVGVNNRSVVHKGSGGMTPCFPDVCKTPTGAGPIPIPYPNVAKSTDSAKCAKTVKCDGNPVCVKDSNFSQSVGDNPGTAGGGIISGTLTSKAEFVSYSPNVKVEGKNVPRAFDLMLHNSKNTPPFPVIQKMIIALPIKTDIDCIICGKPL